MKLIPIDDRICVIHSEGTRSSAGGWWLVHQTHITFGHRNHKFSIPLSVTTLIHKGLFSNWRNSSSGVSQEAILHSPLCHPTPSKSSPAFSQKRVYEPCKNTLEPLHRNITITYQICPKFLFGLIQHNNRKK